MSRRARALRTVEKPGENVESAEIDIPMEQVQTIAGGEPREAEFSGTKALILAVLEDGIRSYLSSVKATADEAEIWVNSRRRRSPFSFVVVCETLSLDPDAVRRVLREMRGARVSPRKALPRSRPNVRTGHRLSTRRRG